MKKCHACGREWTAAKRQPGVKECCEGCGAYLHCCLNCTYHQPSAHNECYIPNTEWVGDRVKCNFCDEFSFADAEEAPRKKADTGKAKSAFDNLFGDNAGHQDKPEGRTGFDKLFGG